MDTVKDTPIPDGALYIETPQDLIRALTQARDLTDSSDRSCKKILLFATQEQLGTIHALCDGIYRAADCIADEATKFATKSGSVDDFHRLYSETKEGLVARRDLRRRIARGGVSGTPVAV